MVKTWSDRYHSQYNNKTYQAVRAELTGAGILDSRTNPDNHIATDCMNLLTDAAWWACGHRDYLGTRDVMISKAAEELWKLIQRHANNTHGIWLVKQAVGAHLVNFGGASQWFKVIRTETDPSPQPFTPSLDMGMWYRLYAPKGLSEKKFVMTVNKVAAKLIDRFGCNPTWDAAVAVRDYCNTIALDSIPRMTTDRLSDRVALSMAHNRPNRYQVKFPAEIAK